MPGVERGTIGLTICLYYSISELTVDVSTLFYRRDRFRTEVRGAEAFDLGASGCLGRPR